MRLNLTTQQLNNSATGLGPAKAAVLCVLGVFAVTLKRNDVQVQGCKAMWESELRRNSDSWCVAVRQSRERRMFHKRIVRKELAHMSYPSCHEMRVTGCSQEVATRRGTSTHVARSSHNAIGVQVRLVPPGRHVGQVRLNRILPQNTHKDLRQMFHVKHSRFAEGTARCRRIAGRFCRRVRGAAFSLCIDCGSR